MNTAIGESPIQGYGLFATSDIEKGEHEDWILPIVEEYKGDRFFIFNNIYDLRQSKLQYINHSDNPNIDYLEIGNKVRIIALRDIQMGEELFIDYGWTEEEKQKRFKEV